LFLSIIGTDIPDRCRRISSLTRGFGSIVIFLLPSPFKRVIVDADDVDNDDDNCCCFLSSLYYMILQ
jgi:hypothetical protein